MKHSLARSPLLFVIAVIAVSACHGEKIVETMRIVYADGVKSEDIEETSRVNVNSGMLIQRHHIRVKDNDAVMSLASIDDQGFATGASYRREGKKGKRYVELKRREDGKLVIFSRGDNETVVLPEKPVVLLDVLHHLHPKPNQDVTLLDLENAEALPARVDATGALVDASGLALVALGGLGGRAEIAAGEAQPQPPKRVPHRAALSDALSPALSTAKAPFIESETPELVTWCRQQTAIEDAVPAATAIALAVKPKLSRERAGGPPSAFWTLKAGGWDEGGAALVVACLRALDHPARVVSGAVKVTDADFVTLVDKTWAQVFDGAHWVDVDATDIDLAGKATFEHTPYVEGMRGPLTTGLAP